MRHPTEPDAVTRSPLTLPISFTSPRVASGGHDINPCEISKEGCPRPGKTIVVE